MDSSQHLLRRVFAYNLQARRIILKISQEELARIAQTHRNTVSLIERSEMSVTLDMVEKLAKALKTEPEFLLKKPKDEALEPGSKLKVGRKPKKKK